MNIVIATSRDWNEWIVEDLKSIYGDKCKFHLIKKNVDLTKEKIDKINPKYIFFPHWSFLVDEDIYKNFECIIFHMTDLPYGRGGSPLQNLILRGHQETQLSAIKCVKELDAGPVYLKNSLSLEGSAREIFERASAIMRDMISTIVDEAPTPADQEGEVVEFKRRTPEESCLEKVDSLEKAYDHIRMLDADGYPQAYLESEFLKFELSNTEKIGEELYARVKISPK